MVGHPSHNGSQKGNSNQRKARKTKSAAPSRKHSGSGADEIHRRSVRKRKHQVDEETIRELEARIHAEAPERGRVERGHTVTDGNVKPADTVATNDLFTSLPLSPMTLQGLAENSFVKMTEIQRGAIPHALCGRDVLGEARTGSGKTLAFLVPLLELLFRQKWTRMDGLGALVVSPTRELSYQIFTVMTGVGGHHDFSAGCIVGGRPLKEEQLSINNMSILVATPGRLLQHLDESSGFETTDLRMLVLDEADRILDFGFEETVHNILSHLQHERQTLLFSATLHSSVHRLGRAALQSPELISVHRDARTRTPETLKQVYMLVALNKKVDTLFSFLRSHSSKKIIVFMSACKQVRFFYEAFRQLKPGPAVMELHGKQSLTKRMVVFQQFTDREQAVALLCTDIAARGIDFPAVDWVLQLDCPESVDSYIHRVGRTARNESCGNSAMFLLPSEEAFIRKLHAARIAVKSISVKQGKLFSVQKKLSSVVAGNADIRHLAKKAFMSYIRSIGLMKDKEIFKVASLPQDTFASSLGLAGPPPLPTSLVGGTDLDHNPLKKRKNQSALQRLKEKIKAKQNAEAGGKIAQVRDSEEDEDLKAEDGKKLSRWERRQRRVAMAVAATENLSKETAAECDGLDKDEVLIPAECQTTGLVGLDSAPLSTMRQRRRLRFRGGAGATGPSNKHTYFSEDGAIVSSLAQVTEDMGGVVDAQLTPKGGNRHSLQAREAFLSNVANCLASRDQSDIAVSRARIHKRHQIARQCNRSSEGEFAAGLGGTSQEPSSMVHSPSPERLQSMAARVPHQQQSDQDNRRPPLVDGIAVGSDLGALEQEALNKLTGSGFFV